MTIKRVILSILAVIAFVIVGGSLISSFTQPQIQSRLELYQTNLILHATEWQPEAENDTQITQLRNSLLGQNGVETALKQYQQLQESAQTNLEQIQTLETASSSSVKKIQQLQDELQVRIGILQVDQGQTERALKTWNDLIENPQSEPNPSLIKTAEVLRGIWSKPDQILPDSESILQQNLDGWFRYRSLEQLYYLQEKPEALVRLATEEQTLAEQAFLKLALISAIPGFGLFFGILLLAFLGIQWAIKRKDSLLAKNTDITWSTPWDGEIILQVFLVGFFLTGQIIAPLGFSYLFKVFNLNPATFPPRIQAFYILATYGVLTTGGLLVLYFSLKPFFPLPEGWFKVNWKGGWFLWGVGGYLVALPLVILVSLINQQLWDGQGGSNPILPIALENRDTIALVVFFVTASIAAPVFEEIMFRGFLLPSLTRYVPLWGAIALSSIIFAVAHLSVSEILPLTVLGIILGVVYTRSRNLLASMLLHGLWNSGTLLSLYILGSGAS